MASISVGIPTAISSAVLQRCPRREYYKYNGGANNRTIDGAFADVGTATGAVLDMGLEEFGVAQGFDAAALTLYLYYRHAEGDLVASSIAGGVANGATIRSVNFEDLDLVIKF